jgi:hypothetical protein
MIIHTASFAPPGNRKRNDGCCEIFRTGGVPQTYAFLRIYESVLVPKFSTYLRENNLLGDYMFHIGYAHRAQLVAVFCSFVGLVLVSIDLVPSVHRVVFTIVVASAAYAMKEACNAVTVMNELVWYKSIFDAHSEQPSNVRPISPRQGGA